tara:strand:- start:1831 stop:2757 length:927 start_codon:yes stop_codon:yes gene_type:complete
MEAAEKLKISAQNLNSVLTTSMEKISATKKRTRKLKAVSILKKKRKKKEMKIEIPSMFKKSVSKIKNKVVGGTGNLFANILGFVSLMLLGVAITNIEEIQEKIDEAKEKLMEGIEPVINFGKLLYTSAKGFVDLFNGSDRDKEYEEILEANKKLEEGGKDLKKLEDDYKELISTYKKVESGEYSKNEGYSLRSEGTLNDGSTFVYKENKDKPYVVTDSKGNVKKYTIQEFVNKFGSNELENIYDRNIDLSSTLLNNDGSIYDFDKNFDSSMIAFDKDISFLTDFNEDMFIDTKKIVYLQKYFVDKGDK